MNPDLPRLSELAERPATRRDFLIKSSAGAIVPFFLAACHPDEGKRESDHENGGSGGHEAGPATALRNPDSKLDTGGHANVHQSTSAASQKPSVAFHRFDPALPPVSAQRTLKIEFTAQEVPIKISDDTTVSAWTFNGDIPGPIVHVKQGDTVEFTLVNHGSIPHSMDFHAAVIDPKIAFRSVAPGQPVSYTFRAKYPGAFLYHCGTSPVLMHIGSGMVGAIIVDPPSPLPAAEEYVLVQCEYYLGAEVGGVQPFDYTKMLATVPDYVSFNGRPGQYMTSPIKAKVGDRVRFYVVNAGPTHPCNFHVVGEQFDTVYLGAPPAMPLRGVQTFAVAPGGGMVFEMLADIPGEFVFVNHGFGHGQKGAIGIISVEA
ncbi:MAG TPA: multicopper oxidase domain-containing protein [Gemmatimonadaceae bacterium]|nr:multicopper oxidase domain-containing protein [Gemmatimonadaceae bacterium]